MRFQSSNTNGASALRLVRDSDDVRDRAVRAIHAARAKSAAESAAENRAARLTAIELPDEDVRTILALKVIGSLEGGRAAILRPELRRRLVSEGAKLGLRPFDTQLVIAIAQDAARRGDATGVGERLRLVGTGSRTPRSTWVFWRLFAAAALASVMVGGAILWLTR